jgi:hypothetical protein
MNSYRLSALIFVAAIGCKESASSAPAMDIDALLAQKDALAQKRVLVKATSWGPMNRTDGGKVLPLAAKPLEGLGMAPVVAEYTAQNLAKMPNAPKNTPVRLVCTVGTVEYDQLQLRDCEVAQ